MSIDTSDNSVKLVTQWNISAISYDNDSSTFEGSYMESWLNDTTVDGFLGNLRNPEKFIKMNSKWNASMMSDGSKPPSESKGGTIVEDPVGLINLYEYTKSGGANSYLNNELNQWTLTPIADLRLYSITNLGSNKNNLTTDYIGIRPTINIKSSIKIIFGDGTEFNPYRLMGDKDTDLEGVKLNTRYSGEYIKFGTDENNLYRIVSHETEGLTKITSAEPLKEDGTFKNISFGDTVYYSSTNTIGSFLNGEYLTNYVGTNCIDMIEDNTTWYLGIVGFSGFYKLTKCTDINCINQTSSTATSKIGLLRYGEIMAGQFNTSNNNSVYWVSTPYSFDRVRQINFNGSSYLHISNENYNGIKPALNLKENVIITSGDGTKENPFELSVQ